LASEKTEKSAAMLATSPCAICLRQKPMTKRYGNAGRYCMTTLNIKLVTKTDLKAEIAELKVDLIKRICAKDSRKQQTERKE
jgi:hypothetical protein